MFTVHCIQLAIGGALSEERRDEELREVVECAREMRGRHVEVEVGELLRRVGVVRAAVFVDEPAVRVLLGVLVGAEEQHVLEEVRQTRQLVRIRHRSCVTEPKPKPKRKDEDYIYSRTKRELTDSDAE